MLFKVFADVVLLLHLFFILFVIFGGFLLLWRRQILLIHLPALVWVVLLELNGWICPLTPLENYWRQSAGEAGYAGGFIDYYLMPIIYPPGLTLDMQWLLGIGVLFLNIGIYGFVFWKLRKSSG